jgi:hypothetical protein
MKPQDLEFETWTELFDYILESKINGQKKQSLELFNALPDREHRQMFIDYVSEAYHYEAMHNNQQDELLETLKFYYEDRNSRELVIS